MGTVIKGVNEYKTLFKKENADIPFCGVTVIITLHNYGHTIIETLDSVKAQTLPGIDLVVVDDVSTDDGVNKVQLWLESHNAVFSRVLFLGHEENQGLAISRNTAVNNTRGEYFFVLDADNHMLPRCAEILKQALDEYTDYAFAYSMIAEFGDAEGVIGTLKWNKELLAKGNYIDAMAMIRKSAWESVGGYKKLQGIGWEDYELWLNFADHEYKGLWVPQILSRYRVHGESMLRVHTKKREQRKLLKKELKRLYPWTEIKH